MGERDLHDYLADEERADYYPPRRPGFFSPKNIIIILVGVAMSSALAVLTVGGYIAPSMERDSAAIPPPSSGEVDASYLDRLEFFRLEPIIVNPAGSNGERYLKAAVALEMHDDAVRAELEKRLPQIKNQINNVLSSKSIKQMQTSEDREKLKREILNHINGILVTGRLSNVYFEEFVYQ
jgi:flagellar FliL protein